MSKYYIIWKDYDNNEIEEILLKENAEKRIVELLHKFEKEEYGGSLGKVIYGDEVEFEIVERVKEVEIKE